jgi:Domain of unknown function (DUF4394)
MPRPFTSPALMAVVAAAAPEAAATTLAALSGDNRLVIINVENRRVARQVTVTGLAGALAGIDVRPADGKLYGVVSNGQIVTINTSNGAATAFGMLTVALPSGQLSVDVNPVADAIRIVGADGTNLRHPFSTGTTVEDADINFASPNPLGDATSIVVAVAYTNSVAGTKTTQLLDIDASPAALYLQIPPNNGTLVALGPIAGATLAASFGFDIDVDADGRNRAWIVSGNRLLQVDPIGGAIFDNDPIKQLSVPVRDVAVLPN